MTDHETRMAAFREDFTKDQENAGKVFDELDPSVDQGTSFQEHQNNAMFSRDGLEMYADALDDRVTKLTREVDDLREDVADLESEARGDSPPSRMEIAREMGLKIVTAYLDEWKKRRLHPNA